MYIYIYTHTYIYKGPQPTAHSFLGDSLVPAARDRAPHSYLSTYLPVYLSTYLPIYLSIYLSIYIYIYIHTYIIYIYIYIERERENTAFLFTRGGHRRGARVFVLMFV